MPKKNKALDTLPKPFFVLAPMDDVTDTVFRQIIADCAPPDLFFTEFVNVDGLQSLGRQKLLPKLRFFDSEHPIVAQIWGREPKNFYNVTKELVQMGFDGVDINFGCPEKNVIKNGLCIAMVNNRELAGEIIRAVREAVGPLFPVSVKTRLGLQQIDYSWHEFLLGYKLNMLTIHGRTAKQMSKVPANWEAIGKIREMRDHLSPATQVVGNGDVRSHSEGKNLAQKYQLDGIMIGRSVFDDPFVFAATSPWGGYSRQQKIDLYAQHVKLFAKTYSHNERALHTLNKFCKVYISGFDGAKELREQLMSAKDSNELLTLINKAI